MDARNIDGSTPLCDACASGSIECVKLLLSYGAKVNPPLYTASPLHEACMSGESLCQRPLEWPSVKHLEPGGGEWPVSMGEGPGSSRRKEFSQETWFKQKFFEIKARQNKDSTERLERAIPWCVQPREF